MGQSCIYESSWKGIYEPLDDRYTPENDCEYNDKYDCEDCPYRYSYDDYKGDLADFAYEQYVDERI